MFNWLCGKSKQQKPRYHFEMESTVLESGEINVRLYTWYDDDIVGMVSEVFKNDETVISRVKTWADNTRAVAVVKVERYAAIVNLSEEFK